MKSLINYIVLIMISLGACQAQNTHADTLRGMLSPIRACYDVHYYHLDIALNPSEKSIAGNVEIAFKMQQTSQQIQVDLFDNFMIDKIMWDGKTLKYTRDGNAVMIDFPEKLSKDSYQSIRFYYHGNPMIAKSAPWDGGFVFTKDKQGDHWIGVACQGTGASCWWPNKDHQSEEPDSMLISVSVPKGYLNVSNGRLRKTTELDNGFTRFDWFVSNPINNYDITLNVAKYEHFSHQMGDLTMDYYVLRENLAKAKKQFEQAKTMMTCFEEKLGPYPFYEDGYKLVETPYLGMEHQSCVAYGNKYMNGYLGNSLSSPIGSKWDYIIIHESGHEWFGNSITTGDIADMWVHEGFTSYTECIYTECMYGKKEYINYVNGLKNNVSNDAPVIGQYNVNKEGSGDMYAKGALLVHTIRTLMDDDVKFYALLKGMCTDFRHQIVTSAQVEEYIISKSGKDLSKVFDQYLRQADIPTLQVKVDTDGSVKVRWQSEVPNFNMPMKISWKGGKYQWMRPNPQWQKLRGVTSIEDIAFAEELFFINVEVVE